jgi:hypothetical protein
MAAKKKPTKKPKTASRKKAKPTNAEKLPHKKVAKQKPVPKKAKKKKKKVVALKQPRKKGKGTNEGAFPLERREPRSGEQSGDLQGLSHLEAADSESVDELVEEGNAFEADVVAGVESAEDADEKEVRTHEVPEDDVPGEYLDED